MTLLHFCLFLLLQLQLQSSGQELADQSCLIDELQAPTVVQVGQGRATVGWGHLLEGTYPSCITQVEVLVVDTPAVTLEGNEELETVLEGLEMCSNLSISVAFTLNQGEVVTSQPWEESWLFMPPSPKIQPDLISSGQFVGTGKLC